MFNTKRSYGLPAASLPTDVRLNHLPTGLDPIMSNQKVGTQRAGDTTVFSFDSMRRSHITKTIQAIKAILGGISSGI